MKMRMMMMIYRDYLRESQVLINQYEVYRTGTHKVHPRTDVTAENSEVQFHAGGYGPYEVQYSLESVELN